MEGICTRLTHISGAYAALSGATFVEPSGRHAFVNSFLKSTYLPRPKTLLTVKPMALSSQRSAKLEFRECKKSYMVDTIAPTHVILKESGHLVNVVEHAIRAVNVTKTTFCAAVTATLRSARSAATIESRKYMV